MIRLYGHSFGEGSFTQVTRGFVEAGKATKTFAGLVPIDALDDETVYPGGKAAVAVNCGAPSAVAYATRLGVHRQRWLMLAPNSDRIPESMVKWLPEFITGLLAPSKWGAEVLRRFFKLPVRVAPHGVPADLTPRPALRLTARCRAEDGLFAVVHLTSTNAERKGTRELLDAWKLLRDRRRLPAEAMLLVIAPQEGLAEQRAWVESRGLGQAPARVAVQGSLSIPSGRFRDFLSLATLICQPSRAEGFGLVPLEARALGIPVAATACTGHSEHVAPGPGVEVIAHGPDAPLDDLPGAMAPSVEPEAIAEAILRVLEHPRLHHEALSAAAAVGKAWSWTAKTGPVLEELCLEADEREVRR